MSIKTAEEINKEKPLNGKVGWKSPSNIAIVKYWGKYGDQFPRNPSISLTLSNAFTETSISYNRAKSTIGTISFLFEGQKAINFLARIENYLNRLDSYFPFLKSLDLKIESKNSFPHSSGIASSASAMSSLALCLCSIEKDLGIAQPDFYRKASFIARLGSGSASRSVFGGVCLWGELDKIKQANNEYAIPLDANVHEVFKSFHDDILIVSSEKKKVSSTKGHQLMDSNPFSKVRYEQAKKACSDLLKVLKEGDLHAFGQIAEREAMSLHALMMCSNPAFILFAPNTIEIIKKLWHFREETNLPVYFTLDAGPNVHLLYPSSIKEAAQYFIKSELLVFCENETLINDKVGFGPEKMIV